MHACADSVRLLTLATGVAVALALPAQAKTARHDATEKAMRGPAPS